MRAGGSRKGPRDSRGTQEELAGWVPWSPPTTRLLEALGRVTRTRNPVCQRPPRYSPTLGLSDLIKKLSRLLLYIPREEATLEPTHWGGKSWAAAPHLWVGVTNMAISRALRRGASSLLLPS